MFSFTVNKNEIIMTESETITSGSVNAYECKFDFSSDWEGLAKTVTFRAGYVKISVILDSTNMCSIPWEVLEKDATQLYCGVRGTVTAYDEEEEAIIPTVYCLLGTIRKGADLGDNAAPPEPSVVDQIMNRIETLDADKQDKLHGVSGQVVGFDADGNAIAQDNESPVYEAGDNISISDGVISAKNSTYSIVKDEEPATPGAVAEYHLVDNTGSNAVIVGDSIAIPDMRYNDTEIRVDIKSVSALTDEVSAATAANTSAISAINDSVSDINAKLGEKQDKLTAGDNVHIENNVISADMYDDTKIRSDIAKLDAGKQNKLHGAAGQVVGFDADGNAIAQDGGSGTPGADGVTFTPSVNALGVISWTNDGGRENPEPVNIKGPQGPQGDPGVAGAAGVDGTDGFSPTVSVSEISNGHKVTITDKNGPHNFNVTDGTDGPAGPAGVDGTDGFSPTVSVSEISNGHKVTITDKNGPHNFNVTDGTDGPAGPAGVDGTDGFSPTVSVSEISNGHKVTITDKNGPHNFNVTDGTDGPAGPAGVDGTDGFSPTVSVSEISNGHKVTITDKNGPHNFNVTDGTDGPAGPAGADGFSPTVSIEETPGGSEITITDKYGAHSFTAIDSVPSYTISEVSFSPSLAEEKEYRLKRDGTATGSTIVTRRHGIYMNGQAATYYIENSAISTVFVSVKTETRRASMDSDSPHANVYVIDSFGDLYVSDFNLYRTREPGNSSSGAKSIWMTREASEMTDLYLLVGNLSITGSPKCLIQHSYALEASGNSSNLIISVTDRAGSTYATDKILMRGKVEYRNVLGSSGLFLRLSPLFLAGEKAVTLGRGYYVLTQL